MTSFSLSAAVPACDTQIVFIRPAAKGKAPELVGPHRLKNAARLLDGLSALGATGAAGESFAVPAGAHSAAGAIVVLGLGADHTPETLRAAVGGAVRAQAGRKKVAITPPAVDSAALIATVEGALLGAYAYTEFKTKASKVTAPVKSIVLVADGLDAEAKAVIARAETTARAVNAARDLSNTPPGHLYPQSFVEIVQGAIGKLPVEVEVMDEVQMRAAGYVGIVGVGQGSQRPPRLLRLVYRPAGATRHLSYVGKGITFDTGGISLKPPTGMNEMKADMSGAAAVVQAVLAIAKLGLPVNVTAYAALAENMVGSMAQRPGDVITTYSGRTVEVLNTDAEGRLVLCDALTRAQEDKPDVVINVATLTGALGIALGPWYSGVMGNDDATIRAVIDAADAAGEYMWHLPLPAMYRPNLASRVADIANIYETAPPVKGGTLYGGLFLQEFINPGQKWVHLDIATPAFNSGGAFGHTPQGATGHAVRTLVEYAHRFC